MSFPVAVQSAIFYFVACTPCAKVRHRHKAKGLAKKERLEKAKLETEQPGLYQHPSPFNTNPFWQEEISMGPSLQKKTTSKNSSQRGLTSSDRESRAPSVSDRTNAGDSRSNIGDSMCALPEDSELDSVSSDWNRKRGYQREDEELWGQWQGNKFMDAITKARDSAGRLIESTLGIDNKEVTQQERRDFYTTPRNPPVNDYHPPVVSSKPPHRDAHKWMLQPPPAAKVMEGKVPVSRAVSSGSKSSGQTLIGDDPHLGKLMFEKFAKEKARRMNSDISETELIESLFITRSNQSLSRSRSLSFDGGSEETLENPLEWRRKSRVRPMAVPPGMGMDDDSDSDSYIPPPRISKTISQPMPAAHVAQRPKLETIPSTDASGGSSRDLTRKSRRSKARRSKLLSGAASPVGDDTD